MKKIFFVTGATGFVGSNLVRKLREDNGEALFFLLARDKKGASAEDRVNKLFPGAYTIKGDVCLGSNLGISSKDISLLNNLLDDHEFELWHAAGEISFDEASFDETFLVNFYGTKNVVEFCKKIGIKRIHYVSTAYVAGDRQELDENRQIAYEKEDFVGQKLRNPYEESKLKAEIYLKKEGEKLGLNVTCYRISVAVGRYENGSANNFSGYYNFCKIIVLNDHMQNGFKAFKPVEMWVPEDATVNIACVDWMVDLMVKISKKNESSGEVFHISNPDPPRASWLMEKSLKVLGKFGIYVDGIKIFTYKHLKKRIIKIPESPLERMILYYQDYAKSQLRFDNTNVQKILGCLPKHPQIDEKLIERLLGFALSRNFGRPVKKILSEKLSV